MMFRTVRTLKQFCCRFFAHHAPAQALADIGGLSTLAKSAYVWNQARHMRHAFELGALTRGGSSGKARPLHFDAHRLPPLISAIQAGLNPPTSTFFPSPTIY
jgi:hypothetical protein